jgi:hypothetical protein
MTLPNQSLTVLAAGLIAVAAFLTGWWLRGRRRPSPDVQPTRDVLAFETRFKQRNPGGAA